MAPQPVLLLDNLGYHNYRESNGTPFLPRRSYNVRLVTDLRLLGQARGPELESVVGVVAGDDEALTEAAMFSAGFGGMSVVAVAAISEALLIPAARLRERLGLPGQRVAEALEFRDKVAMKEVVAARGVVVPEFAVFTVAAANRLLARHGSVVAKPRQGFGSVGVSFLRSSAEIDHFAELNADWLDEFEVEQFCGGEQYHIDGVIRHGELVAATAGRSIDPTTAFETSSPYRDVGLASGALLDKLLAASKTVVGAFERYSGAFHLEMFVCAGQPVFCEIGARAGGGGVVSGFYARTGIDLHQVALQAQLTGQVPESIDVDDRITGYVLLYQGVVPEGIATQPWVIRHTVYRTGSAPAKHWGDAVALVCVDGGTEAEVTGHLTEVIAASGTAPKDRNRT